MPKKPPQNKKSIREKSSRTIAPFARRGKRSSPQSLGRIMQEQGWMQGLRQVRARQLDWVEWLRSVLPEELRAAVVNAVPRGPELVVLAVSAAWSARLRYALAALAPELKVRAPDIVKVAVRVAPAGQSGGPPRIRTTEE
jgi:Dna[CI] antecedent, DciA